MNGGNSDEVARGEREKMQLGNAQKLLTLIMDTHTQSIQYPNYYVK